jgi:glycerol-3-phosphate dehydrogenase (NAD(P)+)
MKRIIENGDPKFSVIGGGSWATAIVKLLTRNGRKVRWYMRSQSAIDHIRKYQHHPSYLPSVELDIEKLDMSSDMNYVAGEGEILIFAIPSAYFMSEIQNLTTDISDKMIVSAVKGFVGEDYITIAEYFNQVHNIPFDRLGVLSGPCHAEEVSRERHSYITISSKHIEVSEYLSGFFKNHYINVVPGTDIYGVEYAAALKNIYAIAAGICVGLNYGDNFLAVLISNAFGEMKRFINATHADINRDTTNSAYLGDLLVTCYSQFSRNRTFGVMIGKSYSVKTAQLEMKQVVEGYYAVKAIHEINQRYNVDMPIADAVYSILYDHWYTDAVINVLRSKLK